MWDAGGTTTTIDVAYDALGNILSKTDIGGRLAIRHFVLRNLGRKTGSHFS